MSNVSDDAALYAQTPEEFRYYADETDISDYFCKVDRSHQMSAKELVQTRVNPWDVSAFLELISLTNVNTRKIMSWEVKNKATLKRPCAPANLARLSDDLEEAILVFLDHQKMLSLNFAASKAGPRVHIDWINPDIRLRKLDEPILLLLVSLYSEEIMLKAMKFWCGNKVSNSMYDFKRLVQDWETFRDVPVEWALDAIGIHSNVSKLDYNLHLRQNDPDGHEELIF